MLCRFPKDAFAGSARDAAPPRSAFGAKLLAEKTEKTNMNLNGIKRKTGAARLPATALVALVALLGSAAAEEPRAEKPSTATKENGKAETGKKAAGKIFAELGNLRLPLAKVNKMVGFTAYLLKMRNPAFRPSQTWLKQMRRRAANDWFEIQLLKRHAAATGLAVPKDKVNKSFEALKQNLSRQGIKVEEFIAKQGMTPAEFKGNMGAVLAVRESLKAKVSDEELKKIFERDRDFIPLRSVSHILFAWKGADRSKATRSKEEALALARETRAKLLAGADFGEMATKLSDDPAAAKNHGSYGFVPRRGVMVEPFSAALYALKNVGDISAPVETGFGCHLIKLNALRSYEDVKENVREVAAKRLYDNLRKKLFAAAGKIIWHKSTE